MKAGIDLFSWRSHDAERDHRPDHPADMPVTVGGRRQGETDRRFLHIWLIGVALIVLG